MGVAIGMILPMRGFVAPTDHGWYQFLGARAEFDEVNFWRPGAKPFGALSSGEPLFFKLKLAMLTPTEYEHLHTTTTPADSRTSTPRNRGQTSPAVPTRSAC